jgi:hypothetical protein
LGVDRKRRNGVLGVEHQAVQVGQDSEYRLAGALFQPVETGLEQADVAGAKVDLDRRLGAFDQHRVVSCGPPPPGGENRVHHLWLVAW